MTFFAESEILEWLIRNGYLVMFLVMLIEGPAVTAIGALGAALGHFNVFIVFILSFFANFLPDVLYYYIGHWCGQWVLDKFGPRIGVPVERRERAAELITNHMGKWLLFIKTIPFISPPGLAVMGALGVSVKRFIWWDMAIVALTSLFFTALGYYSGQGYGFLQRGVRVRGLMVGWVLYAVPVGDIYLQPYRPTIHSKDTAIRRRGEPGATIRFVAVSCKRPSPSLKGRG